MLHSRLLNIRKNMELSQKDMAKQLHISQQAYNNYEKGKRAIPNELLIKINKLFNINTNWLLTGKGSMHTNDNSLQKADDSDTIEIERLSLQASAGVGIENFEVETLGKIKLSTSVFRTHPNPKHLKVIEVIGDSMEPTLQEGDLVVTDTAHQHTVDGIYAINIQGEVFIKRLQFKLNGTIKIISDNPKYETMTYNPKESKDINFNVIGRKVLLIQR